ncbi:MAG: DNA primase [Acidobacteriota bacterium]
MWTGLARTLRLPSTRVLPVTGSQAPDGSRRPPIGVTDSSARSAPHGRGFPPEFVEEVRSASRIVEVVSEHVTLKRAGRSWKGLCPFHGEKTPSFHVDEAKGFYHCFGCGEGGDVYRFVMQIDALSFPEAVKHLASRSGIPIPERRQPDARDQLRERLFLVNDTAQSFFVSSLQGNEGRNARAYLERRGFGQEIQEGFGLGLAPEGWQNLRDELGRRRIEEREMTASGLIVRAEGGRTYDRFRSRITIPIRALSGRTVSFGGRILGDGEPKYLNGPETAVYSKGEQLFGLDRARTAIRRSQRAVLVEGFFDAIALHAGGIQESVAVLGTALTPGQARLLSRFTEKVILCFDGDEAGQRATKKSLEILLAEGLDVSVLTLPGGEDPDDALKARGREDFLRRLDGASSFFDFLIRVSAREHDLATPSGRVKALGELLPFVVNARDPVLRAELTDTAASGLGLRPELVRDQVRQHLRRGGGGPVHSGLEEVLEDSEITTAERTLLSWLISEARVRELFRSRMGEEGWALLSRGGLYETLLSEPDDGFDLSHALEALPHQAWRRLVTRCAFDADLEPVPSEDLSEKVGDLLARLGISSQARARQDKAEIERELVSAINSGELDRARELQDRLQELAKAMYA